MYLLLFPDPADPRVGRELERRERQRARDAARFGRSGHQHDNLMPYPAAAAAPDPAASGIAARRAERIAADPADPAAGASDEQLLEQLFGPDAGP